jgi:hypothetical protein
VHGAENQNIEVAEVISYQKTMRRECAFGLKLNFQAMDYGCTPTVQPVGSMQSGYFASQPQDKEMRAALQGCGNQDGQPQSGPQTRSFVLARFHVCRGRRDRKPCYCWIELAVAEKALLALAPIKRMVPTTKTRITANITAYSAMS